MYKPIILIIDTNVWIYMANGEMKDSVGNRIHIKVFKILKDLVENGDIELLISPIVLEEFDRNKTRSQKYINQLNGYVTERTNYLKNHRNALPDDKIQEIQANIILREDEIKINQQHINEVEKFLKSKSVCVVPITETVKSKCFDQALAKKAPFKGKKSNSMADMAILLSAIEYVKSNLSTELIEDLVIHPKTIFISCNTSDFSQDKQSNIEKIHPDLQPFLSSVDMEYSISLGKTLNSISDMKISVEEIEEMDDYLPYDFIECPNCADWDERLGVLDSNSIATLINENIPRPAPKEQLTIPFEYNEEDIEREKVRPQRVSSIMLLQCNWCNCQFFSCPVCGEMVMYDEEVQCDNCETKFECYDEYDCKGFLIKQTVKMLAYE